jgi:hypothetical protein
MSFPSQLSQLWAFNQVLDLDRFERGLAGDVMRATPYRRQVICAVLAAADSSQLDQGGKLTLARRLRFARSKALLAESFDPVPSGFVRCLRMLKECYQSPAFYQGLYRLFTKPPGTAVVDFLNHREGLDEGFVSEVLLQIVRLERLGDAFLNLDLLPVLGECWRAIDIERVTGFIRRFVPDAKDEELVASFLAADPARPIEQVISSWVRHTGRDPINELSNHPEFERLTTRPQLKRVAREFRNCLAGTFYIRLAQDGLGVLFAWRGTEPAILRLNKRTLVWRVRELAGIRNQELSPASLAALADILEPMGIVGPSVTGGSYWVETPSPI